jgi:hypothetical protein
MALFWRLAQRGRANEFKEFRMNTAAPWQCPAFVTTTATDCVLPSVKTPSAPSDW